jgi:hypothetical protein
LSAHAKTSASNHAPKHVHATDLHGIGRLVLLVLDIVIDRIEAMHVKWTAAAGRPAGPGGCAYRKARAATAMAGRLVDKALGRPHAHASSRERDTVLAVLNGLFGDLLERLDNPLAIRMCVRQHGRPLPLEPAALAAAATAPSGRLLVLVPGLCCCDLQWLRRNHDHGAALGRDLGYTPLYLYYNSGRHVSTNGQDLSDLLEQLVHAWPVPVEELAILGHSMGGLVARSACHYARARRQAWLARLTHLVFLGTPHHGAPLERHGNWLGAVLGRNALTAPFARLGELRSEGITDLRYGNLLDEDWQGRHRFAHAGDLRHRVPLPKGVRCYAIAASIGRAGDMRGRLLGDGLLPVDTALGRHGESTRNLSFPAGRQWVAFNTHHLDLLSRVEVYEKIRCWLAQRLTPPRPPPASGSGNRTPTAPPSPRRPPRSRSA